MRRPPGPSRDPRVRRSALGALLCGLLSLASAGAAQEAGEDELAYWAPSFALFYDMLGNRAEGEITTSNVMQTPATTCGPFNQDLFGCPDSPLAITFPTASDDTDVAPSVGGSLELMTPRLLEALFAPRLFAHGDVAASFGFERNLAGERKPGPFFAELEPPNTEIFERSVGGQGSRAKLQVRRWVYGAGAGVAFTGSIFQRTIRVKPSFEYFTHEVDLIASVRRAVKLVDPTDDLTLGGFHLIALEASSTETLHALGAGLELEADAGRLGPLVLAVFVMGRGYRYTGNLNHTFTDSNEFGESAVWRFEIDPWLWRAGIGLRFRWVPE